MSVLKKILHIIDTFNEWLGKIFGFLILGLIFVVVFDTCMRYLFNRPTMWALSMTEILLLAIICLGGGYTFLHGGHVKIDIFYVRLSERKKAFLDLITYLCVFLFCGIIIIYGGQNAWIAFTSGEVASESSWDYILWPVLTLIPVGGLLIGLQGLAKWIRDLVIVITGENKLESTVFRGEGGIR